MKIELQKVVPHPMIEIIEKNSQVWDVEHLTFNQAEKYLIKAESGKGKTTLLSVIYGIRKDYNGTVLIHGKNIKDHRLADWTRLRQDNLSYIFQGLRLFPSLTVWENIEIKNRLTKYKTSSQIKEMAQILDVENLLPRKASTLSFGQQQRIAIIRALCQPLDYLLLDEPFSHLDPGNTQKALNLIITECQQQDAGLILTTLDNEYPDFIFKKLIL